MRAIGLLFSLVVMLLSTQAWAVSKMGIATPSSIFVRPFDATTYAIGDLVANSAVAANVVPLSWNIVSSPNNGVFIRRVNIIKSTTGVVAPNFRLHLFTTSPTSAVGDNGVYSSTSVGWFCDMDVNMYTTDPFSDGNAGIGVPNNGAECAVVPVGSTIYGLLEARGAYVPTSSEVFIVGLEVYIPGGGGGGNVAVAPSWIIPRATIDYDFVSQRYWNSGAATNFTFTRATAETCTDSNGTLSYVTANNPCITNLGYQTWIANTNLLLQSQFAASWTATRSTLTANAATSPDGTANAATLVEDATATSTHLTTQTLVKAASALPYTFSVYAKSGTRTRIDLQLDDNAGNGAVMVCDLAGKQVGVTTAAVGGAPFTVLNASVSGYANGWTRCSMAATSNTAVALVATVFLDSGSGTAAISNSYSGDGVSGVTIFGAQIEQNTATTVVPSPYIPTTVASATRNASCLAAPATVGQQFTQWVMATAQTPITNAAAQEIFYLDDGKTTNRSVLRRAATTALAQDIVITGGVTQFTTTAGAAMPQDGQAEVATSMMQGRQLISYNGTTATQDNSATLSSLTSNIKAMHVGCGVGATAQYNGYIKRVAVLGNTFVSNLGELTTR